MIPQKFRLRIVGLRTGRLIDEFVFEERSQEAARAYARSYAAGPEYRLLLDSRTGGKWETFADLHP